MLTPDEVKHRIEQAGSYLHTDQSESALVAVLYLLQDVLPDLVAAVQKTDDAGSRYRCLSDYPSTGAR